MILWTTAVVVGALVLLGWAGTVFLKRRRNAARRRYREHLERALEDGILTPDEMRELEALRDESGLGETELHMVACAIYRRALRDATADARITPEEEAGLQRLRAQLGVSNADLEADRGQLQRLRLLAGIERGELPEVEPPVPLSAGERCHWVVRSTLGEPMDAAAPGSAPSDSQAFSVQDVAPFQAVETRGVLGERVGFAPLDHGMLLVTSRRTFFQGAHRRLTLPHVRLREILLFRDGLALRMAEERSDHTILSEDVELTAAILLHAARRRQAELDVASRMH